MSSLSVLLQACDYVEFGIQGGTTSCSGSQAPCLTDPPKSGLCDISSPCTPSVTVAPPSSALLGAGQRLQFCRFLGRDMHGNEHFQEETTLPPFAPTNLALGPGQHRLFHIDADGHYSLIGLLFWV